jgi:hypothetical protein
LKPPRPGTSTSANAASPADYNKKENTILNPFDTSKSIQTKSIPEILEILSKINLDLTFGSKEVKVNKLYTILTSELSVAI